MLSGEALVHFGTAPPEELAHDALHRISQQRHVLQMRNSERKMRWVEWQMVVRDAFSNHLQGWPFKIRGDPPGVVDSEADLKLAEVAMCSAAAEATSTVVERMLSIWVPPQP